MPSRQALIMARIAAALAFSWISLAYLVACGDKELVTIDYSGALDDWPSFGGEVGGGHYSEASQITKENVRHLERAWEYRSGDMREVGTSTLELVDGVERSTMSSSWQMTPILVGDTLYGCTAFNRIFALDPESGVKKWSFDPEVDTSKEFIMNCRGVSSWQSGSSHGGQCEHRIFSGTMDGRLLAVDAADGQPCLDFGESGQVNLHEGLGSVVDYEYSITSPPAVIGNIVVTGSNVMDRTHSNMPSGVVRAYDVITGELKWFWDAAPPTDKETDGNDADLEYTRGTTNVWSIMSVDVERDLIFLPTGNTSTDFFGGDRGGNFDHYSSSVVALKASTGEVVWSFQTVRHDIWDYDVPSQPTLFEIERDGKVIPALAQPTKMGHLFILNRETGEPLFPVEERPVPQVGQVPEEYLSPTQPFPVMPKPLHPAGLTADDAWGFTFWDRAKCREQISNLVNEGIFTPPSLQGSVFFPSDYGGNNWGSPAIDKERNLIVLSTLFMPASLKLIPRDDCDISDDLNWPQLGTPYCLRVEPLMSPFGAPCSAPPWSTLVALDLNTGEKRWEVPLGTLEGLAPWPLSRIKGGAMSGGPSVTAAGVTFIAAGSDMYIRAFDTDAGEELWKDKLPTGGHAVPMTYRIDKDGRQYVVIAAGAHPGMPHEPIGDWLIAYALPKH